MYTGEMIEELVRCVQRAEESAQVSGQMTLKKAVFNAAGDSTYIYEAEQPEPMAVA